MWWCKGVGGVSISLSCGDLSDGVEGGVDNAGGDCVCGGGVRSSGVSGGVYGGVSICVRCEDGVSGGGVGDGGVVSSDVGGVNSDGGGVCSGLSSGE